MISTDSKYGAACRAKCMESTAPMAKLGAIRMAAPGFSDSQACTWSRRSWVKPVVPTTA